MDSLCIVIHTTFSGPSVWLGADSVYVLGLDEGWAIYCLIHYNITPDQNTKKGMKEIKEAAAIAPLWRNSCGFFVISIYHPALRSILG